MCSNETNLAPHWGQLLIALILKGRSDTSELAYGSMTFRLSTRLQLEKQPLDRLVLLGAAAWHVLRVHKGSEVPSQLHSARQKEAQAAGSPLRSS